MRPDSLKAPQARSIETTYRARQVTGLLIVAALIIAFSLARANWHEVFPSGWWRVW